MVHYHGAIFLDNRCRWQLKVAYSKFINLSHLVQEQKEMPIKSAVRSERPK